MEIGLALPGSAGILPVGCRRSQATSDHLQPALVRQAQLLFIAEGGVQTDEEAIANLFRTGNGGGVQPFIETNKEAMGARFRFHLPDPILWVEFQVKV